MRRSTLTLGLMVLVTVSLLLLGCIPTLHSVFNDDDLVSEPALLGAWKPTGGGEADRWAFSKGDGKAYRLEQTDDQGTGEFAARLGRFNDLLVLELQPQPTETQTSAMHKAYRVPIRTFFVVDTLEPTLKLSAMKMDWLQAHLKQNPDALKHEVVRDSEVVLITASTDELQAFIAAQRGTAEAWAPAELERIAE